jgi:hypothetical protein
VALAALCAFAPLREALGFADASCAFLRFITLVEQRALHSALFCRPPKRAQDSNWGLIFGFRFGPYVLTFKWR